MITVLVMLRVIDSTVVLIVVLTRNIGVFVFCFLGRGRSRWDLRAAASIDVHSASSPVCVLIHYGVLRWF